MPPKKKVKNTEDLTKLQLQNVQDDHDIFLQTFEKPTQIYRYLRTRWIVSPSFLHRTCSYLRKRCSRTNQRRSQFKVDSLLELAESRHKLQSAVNSFKSEYMTLNFTGLFDSDGELECDSAEVNVSLLRICHKKRKDITSPIQHTVIGRVDIPVNREQKSPRKVQVLSIPREHFSQNNSNLVKTFMLVIRVTPGGRIHNGSLYNGDKDEPPYKKTKRRRGYDYFDEEVTYGADLVVYDKHENCMLTEGSYDIVLREIYDESSNKRRASWETVNDGKAVGPFEVFNICPTLKFKLQWSEEPLTSITCPSPVSSSDASSDVQSSLSEEINIYCSDKDMQKNKSYRDLYSPRKRKHRIFYQFRYHSNTSQQTETHNDYMCPWCSINCFQLYGLLKHLRLSHPRFSFTYEHHPKGATIYVSMNDNYDGSYLGNPQDTQSNLGYAFCRLGPVRRTPVTSIIVYRPVHPKQSISEFLEVEDSESTLTSKQYVQGHNRLYYHTLTCQAVSACEFYEDSEDENDPEWLRQKSINMIDEFTDVNEGEKELMKLWNLHIMRHKYISDCQITTACQSFIDIHGEEIIKRNLCRNFLLHMVNLYDFSMIKPELVSQMMSHLRDKYYANVTKDS